MNITIIPGSYKPPHKGHLSLLEKLIKNKKTLKIIMIVSKKQRPLDSRFLYPLEHSKEELQNALIEYFPSNKDDILLMTKALIIKKINEMISKNILKSVNASQSLQVWNIYLDYLKKKYSNIVFPMIIFKIPETNNIIVETNKVILEIFREYKLSENIKPKIILMKSMKNEHNTRFDSLEKRYKKYIEIKLFPNIKDIDATGMRDAILKLDKDRFLTYLPEDLNIKEKNKIWKIFI